MKYQGRILTKEQVRNVRLAKTEQDLIIQSPAGSGKTFILRVIANFLRKKGKNGVLITFNKAIADEAKLVFPKNVKCITGHSLAYGKEGWKYKNRLNKINGYYLADNLDIGKVFPFSSLPVKGYVILEIIKIFCYSTDTIITKKHLPDIILVNRKLTVTEQQNSCKDLISQAINVWHDMINVKKTINITHDVYLKLWSLKNPKLAVDFILFDEAQDANPVILNIIQQQNCQKIYVGDNFQQIYSWRGAINAMQTIKAKHYGLITKSFRFGKVIAEKANEILNGYLNLKHKVKIKGNKNLNSKICSLEFPDVIICRTNSVVIENLIKEIDYYCIYIQGGTWELIKLIKGAQDLINHKKTVIPELLLFNTWDEVKDFVDTDNGQELRSLVNIIENYGTKKLLEVLHKTEKNIEDADIIITTAHKAKGLQWNNVKLANDFIGPDSDKWQPEEVNILYVALTRALKKLDITECEAAYPKKVLKDLKKSNIILYEKFIKYKYTEEDKDTGDIKDKDTEEEIIRLKLKNKELEDVITELKVVRKNRICKNCSYWIEEDCNKDWETSAEEEVCEDFRKRKQRGNIKDE